MKAKINNSSILSNIDNKIFLLTLQFSSHLKQFFYLKNILITNLYLIINHNVLHVSLYLFFRKKKLIKYKSLFLRKKKFIIYSKDNILFFLSKHLHTKFKTSSIYLIIKVINKFILFRFFFKGLKREFLKLKFFKKFKNKLFTRQVGLYSDFLKLTVLYEFSKIKLHSYLFIIGEIFKRLTKKKHTLFLSFIKNLFQFLIFKHKKKSFFNKILGVKFILSGKIRGKLRARSVSIKLGSVSIINEVKNIDFSYIHIFTIYGTYGIKLWIEKEIALDTDLIKYISKFKRSLKSKKRRFKKHFKRLKRFF
jgi:hypothetical protein